ncbi:MAG: hypothetical protein LBN74_06970, partial [Prevotella sp.]|nr:hypothetical protein [Prevotella sp.]
MEASGYTLIGWTTANGSSTAVMADTAPLGLGSGTQYTANAAVTVYPVWKANSYTITYAKGANP